eukprot:5168346-Pyramimonas_sp.AAC.1
MLVEVWGPKVPLEIGDGKCGDSLDPAEVRQRVEGAQPRLAAGSGGNRGEGRGAPWLHARR